MGILNRRNAVLGWLVWLVAKRQLRKKAKQAVPFTEESSGRGRLVAIVLGAAAAVGAVVLWRKLRGSEDDWHSDTPAWESAEPTPITSVRDDDVPPAA